MKLKEFIFSCIVGSAAFQGSLGAVWSPPVTLSTSNAAASQVAVNAAGDAIALWQRTDGSTYRIEASSLPFLGAWSMPATLSAVGQNAFVPQVGLDPNSNAVAVWLRYNGSNYVVQSSTAPFGGLWTVPLTVSAAGQNALEPQVAVDPSGNAVAVWTRVNGGFTIAQASTLAFGSNSWSAPVDLSAAGQNAQDAHVGVDAAGNAVAVWARFNGSNYIVQSSRLPFGGSWTLPVDLSQPGQDAILSQVAVDPAGDAIAVWARFNGTNEIIQAARLPFGGSWTAPVDLSLPGNDAQDPHLAIDKNGNAVAVWSRNNGTNNIVQAVYYTAGGSWSAPVDLSATGQNAYQAHVAFDGLGNAMAAWNRNSIIQVSTLPVGWNWTIPVDISTSGLLSEAPHVAMNATGYAVVDWRCDSLQAIQAATWTPQCSIAPSCPNFCTLCREADCPDRCDGCPIACPSPCQPCPECVCKCEPHVSVRPTLACSSSDSFDVGHKHKVKKKSSRKKK